MATLYVLTRSPFAMGDLEKIVDLTWKGDGILLLQDAVLAIKSSPFSKKLSDLNGKGVNLYAVDADTEARAVNPPPWVELVNYGDIVELLAGYAKTYS